MFTPEVLVLTEDGEKRVGDLVEDEWILDGNGNPDKIIRIDTVTDADVLIAIFGESSGKYFAIEAEANTPILTDRGLVPLERLTWKDEIHTFNGKFSTTKLANIGISVRTKVYGLFLDTKESCIANSIVVGIREV